MLKKSSATELQPSTDMKEYYFLYEQPEQLCFPEITEVAVFPMKKAVIARHLLKYCALSKGPQVSLEPEKQMW